MRWIVAATGLATVIAIGACGATVTPSPSPTTATPTERVQIFYARADEPPLAAASRIGPGSSFNVLGDTARVGAVAVRGDLANLDFTVDEDGWGVPDSVALRAFLEQVVYTATDEKSIYKVKLTQNGGEDAEIATDSAIATYRTPLTREIVTPLARPDHTVAYFARDLDLPVAVFLEGAGIGATPEERIRSRLVALENGPVRIEPDAYNVVATMRALVQQLVFTASEEPGIVRVMITQNGEAGALIGGEGLVIDRPQTRRGLLGE